MPGQQDEITSFVDIEKMNIERVQVLDYLNTVLSTIGKINGTKFDLDKSNTFKTAGEAVQKYKTQIDELQRIEQQLITVYEKRQAATSQQAKDLAEERVLLQQKNAELKNEAQLTLATTNSINEARAKVSLLTKERNSLNIATAEGQARLKDLNSEINKNNDFIKANVSALEQQKINIGNYAGSFASALGFLNTELGEIKQKLADPSLQGAQLEQLRKEEALLTQLTENLGQEFSTSRQEVRAFTEASVQLGTQLGATNETVLQFQREVGEAVNEVQDLKSTIKFQASDTKYLDGAVAAVQGLAGAYSAASGAVMLFGDDNEQVQKQMAKFMALLQILNGIQALQNSLQTENGAVQTVLAAKTGLLNAAKAIQAKLTITTAAAQQAESVAMAEGVVATESATVAQAENAVATEGATIAMGEEAAAATAATVATRTFSTALIATGIGAAIAAIAAVVALLVSKINDWASAGIRMLKAQTDLAEATRDANQTLTEQIDLIAQADTATKRYYQNQLDAASASGQNQYKILALKKQLYEEDKRLAQQQIDYLGATNDQQAKLLSQQQNLEQKKQILEQQRVALIQRQANGEDLNGDDKKYAEETLPNLIKSYDAGIQSIKTIYEKGQKAREDLFSSDHNLYQNDVDLQKLSEDEKRKVILESTQLESDLIKSKNDTILNDDRSSLSQRLNALKGNLEAERQAIAAQKNDVLNNPSSTEADKLLANKSANEQIEKANIAFNQEVYKTNEDYRLRDLAAEKTILEQKLQEDIDINKRLAADTEQTFNARLSAYQKYIQDEKVLEDADYKNKLSQVGFSQKEIDTFIKTGKYQIANKKITNDELIALEKTHESNILKIGIDANTSLTDIMKAELQKQQALQSENVARIQETYNRLDLKSNVDYSKDVIDLNKSLIAKKISYEKYTKERTKLDTDYQAKLQINQIESINKELELYTGAADKEAAAELKVAKLRLDLSKATNNVDKQKISNALQVAIEEYNVNKANADKEVQLEQQKTEAIKKINDQANQDYIGSKQKLKQMEIDLAGQLLNALQSGVDAGYDNKNAAIQKEMDLLDKRTQKEIDGINASTMAQVDKDKQIKLLQDRQQAQKDQLAEKQKQNDRKKAQFDRAIQVASIIGSEVQTVASLEAEEAMATAKAAIYAASALINPIYAPAAASMAAAVGVIGAEIPISIALAGAQIAALLASPLPAYEHGTMDATGGLSLVSERRPELVITPSGEMFKTPDTPSLVNIPKHSMVLPDYNLLLSMANQQGGFAATMSGMPKFQQADYSPITGSLKRVEKAIKEMPQPHITIEGRMKKWVRSGYNWNNIIGRD